MGILVKERPIQYVRFRRGGEWEIYVGASKMFHN